jgi:hypothetical protein
MRLLFEGRWFHKAMWCAGYPLNSASSGLRCEGHSRSHLFCPLARHLSGTHPTHSLDAVVDSLRASELLECRRCRPDLNADRAPTEAAVVTKGQDPACTGLFRVVVHPRHGLGSPARNSALGASLVVLRPRRGPWEVELGVTKTGSIQSPTRRGLIKTSNPGFYWFKTRNGGQ